MNCHGEQGEEGNVMKEKVYITLLPSASTPILH